MTEHAAVQLTQQLVRLRTTPDRGQAPAAELLADRSKTPVSRSARTQAPEAPTW